MRPIATYFVLIATAFVAFATWIDPRVLFPTHVDWLLDGQDRGQAAIGMAAYLSGGGWPMLGIPGLMAPEGSSVLLTDSIPLLALVLGPFARVLPAGIQFIGPWLFSCMVLQFLFAWALVRPHARDALAAWLAACLLAFAPVLLNRFGHASLCAQWLILWGLWIHADRSRSAYLGWWLALLGVAALVHFYLLLMVAAIWGGALLERAAMGERGRVLAQGTVGVGLVALILGYEGAFGQGFGSTGTYGQFPLALDAWINPANPGFTALMPSSPENNGLGYEGFQYLGLGGIAVVVLALVGARAGARRLAWLIPGFALLALVGIGARPLLWGRPLFALPLPGGVIDALDPVRAAGRLFWPATYALMLFALVNVLALRRAAVVLALCLAVQLLDLAPMLAAIRPTSAPLAERGLAPRMKDPRWTALIARARQVDFYPAEPFADLQLLEEASWRAVLRGRPTGYSYGARVPARSRERLAWEAAAVEHGLVAPGHLLIFLDGRVPPALAARARRIDGIAFVAPVAP